MPAAEALYRRLVHVDDSGDQLSGDQLSGDQLSSAAQTHVARNGLRQMLANGLLSTGDQIVNAKTVLPWLLTSIGAPSSLLAMLVPIRESGSMLPQAAMSPWVQRHRVRKWIWVAGGAGQAFATAAMALLAATTTGLSAGIGVLTALAVFSLARAMTSLSGKDVLGRTVPKGQRGQINGVTTVLSGIVAVTVGVALRVLGGDDVSATVLAALLGGAALTWVVAAAVYAGVREPADEPSPAAGEGPGWVAQSWELLRDDRTFRRFVSVRSLLLVSALSPPFVVAIGAAEGGAGLSGLGPFVIAQGVASLVGGRVFGRLADWSSRLLMIGGAAAASTVILVFLALLPVARDAQWLYPAVYLLLALTHTGARVARKTYVIDLAEGEQRTAYVAVANTAMGVLLLITGAVSGALAMLGNEAALAFLAVLGLLGVLAGRTLPDVSKH